MIPHLTTRETGLLAATVALLLLAALGPSIPQPAGYHAFADRRTLAGIPFAMDVLTNLAFAAWGIAGLLALRSRRGARRDTAAARGAGLFFAGLLATAFGSGWYHSAPADAGLLIDRLCMAIAFSGLLSLMAAERVSERAGRALAWAGPVLGCAGAAAWGASGSVLPWIVFQFGGMALLLGGAALSPVGGGSPVRWLGVILLYGIAKALELADQAVFDLTGGVVSGHSLKHVVAAFTAWPVLHALRIAGTVVPDSVPAPGSAPAR